MAQIVALKALNLRHNDEAATRGNPTAARDSGAALQLCCSQKKETVTSSLCVASRASSGDNNCLQQRPGLHRLSVPRYAKTDSGLSEGRPPHSCPFSGTDRQCATNFLELDPGTNGKNFH